MSQWYNQDISRVKKMAERGSPTAEIAEAVGRSTSAVRSLLRRFGISPNNPATYFSENEDQIVASMYDGGSMVMEIARELGRTRNSIIGRISRLRMKGLITRKDEPKGRKSLSPSSRVRKDRKPKIATIPNVVKFPSMEPVEPAKEEAWLPLPGSNPVPVHMHTKGCTWPIGDGPILYCNEPTEDYMWCPTHKAMGTRKVKAPGAEKGRSTGAMPRGRR